MKDYYKILEVSRKANAAEIRKSYRRLCKQYHPDRNQNKAEAHSQFVEVQEAYQTLSNPTKKVLYDERLIHGANVRSGSSATTRTNTAARAHRSGQYVRVEEEDELTFQQMLVRAFAALSIFLGILLVVVMSGWAKSNEDHFKTAFVHETNQPEIISFTEAVSRNEIYGAEISSLFQRSTFKDISKKVKEIQLTLHKEPYRKLDLASIKIFDSYKKIISDQGVSASKVKTRVVSDGGSVPFRHEMNVQILSSPK